MEEVEQERRAQERRARSALQDLALVMADKWASSFENRPTQQIVLQKLIDPIVQHVLNSVFPWIVGAAILFLILLTCTVVTCVSVLRSPVPVSRVVLASALA